MSSTFAPVLGEATVQELREEIHGSVLCAADDGYAEAISPYTGRLMGRVEIPTGTTIARRGAARRSTSRNGTIA